MSPHDRRHDAPQPAPPRNGLSERDKLSAVVAGAWRSFDSAASLKSLVSPAMPILFFGDLDALSAYFRTCPYAQWLARH